MPNLRHAQVLSHTVHSVIPSLCGAGAQGLTCARGASSTTQLHLAHVLVSAVARYSRESSQDPRGLGLPAGSADK